jgi:D-arabinose 1-dehydrogenase-like Zn-dependent alcohol dehydrogenase
VPGTTAVVIGVGGVGHIALQLVRELGSSRVIAVDTDERARRLASSSARTRWSTARRSSTRCAT